MTGLGLTKNVNANTQNEYANVAASHEGSLYADDTGASYQGSTSMDASASLPSDVPQVSELPEVPMDTSVAGDVTGALEGATGDLHGQLDGALHGELDGALSGVHDAGLPDLDGVQGSVEGALAGHADVSTEGVSVGAGGMLEGWLDALGDVMANVSASVSAMLGL